MTDEHKKGTGVWSGIKIKHEPPKEEGESKEEASPAKTKSDKKMETNMK